MLFRSCKASLMEMGAEELMLFIRPLSPCLVFSLFHTFHCLSGKGNIKEMPFSAQTAGGAMGSSDLGLQSIQNYHFSPLKISARSPTREIHVWVLISLAGMFPEQKGRLGYSAGQVRFLR